MDLLQQAKKTLMKQPQSRKGAAIIALGVLVWYSLKKKSPKKSSSLSTPSSSSSPSTSFIDGVIRHFVPQIGQDLRERPVKFDKDFFARFHYILQTCFPSIWCRETLLLGLLTSALCARTYLTIVISEVIATSVQNFVERDFENGKWKVFSFQILSIIAAFVNAGLKYVTTMLAALIRDRLTKKAHDIYMKDMNYYKVNFVGSKTLENTDQLISEDIELLSSQFATIYTNLLKPIVDLVIFTIKLAATMDITGPVGMYGYFGFASLISTLVLPPYAKLHAVMQEKEGRLREYEKRLINNAEMVAFMGGEGPEKKILNSAYESIFSQVMYVARRKLFADMVMGYVNKYAASSVGFLLLVLPYYLGKKDAVSSTEITATYVKCAQLMEGLADAVLRLFEVQKEVGQLSGLSSRVYNLFYTMNNPEVLPIPVSSEFPPERKSSDGLAFRNVTVYKPDGRVLVKNLTLDIPPGQRVIITGENGCGKSSLFRVLRKLWPLAEGTILQPDQLDSFYFLSQVNFVPIGSLREIIIYPHSVEEMKAKGKTDEDLKELLKYTRLEDLELNDERPTFDTVWDWNTALSPGQKQRIAFSRLFYHKPQYAVLDECTNGVAPGVENELYNRCTELGITVFSISHKLELKALHDYELHYLSDGKGGFEFTKLNEGKEKE